MTQSYIRFDRTGFGTTFSIEENPFVFRDSKEFIDSEFQRLLEKNEGMQVDRELFDKIFAENSQNHIAQQITTALNELKDTQGGKIDFSALDTKKQGFVLSFLMKAFDDYAVYGTKAQISEVQINATSQYFYIQANIHTIDGQFFSTAAKFAPKTDEYVKKYDKIGFVGGFDDGDRDYKIYFAKAGNLGTSERISLLNEIENSRIEDLEGFEGDIEIAFHSFSGDKKAYGGVVLYCVTNIKLDLEKALEVVKNMPENEPLKAKNQSLLDIFWAKFKAEIEFSMYQAKQKQKNEEFLSSLKETNLKGVNSLKGLLNSADETNFLQGERV